MDGKGSRGLNGVNDRMSDEDCSPIHQWGGDLASQSSPSGKNIFVFFLRKSPAYSPRPVPPRGAFHDRRERWARDAVDAAVPPRAYARGRTACRVRRNRVVLTHQGWRQVGYDA
jgi:hypothetical protein